MLESKNWSWGIPCNQMYLQMLIICFVDEDLSSLKAHPCFPRYFVQVFLIREYVPPWYVFAMRPNKNRMRFIAKKNWSTWGQVTFTTDILTTLEHFSFKSQKIPTQPNEFRITNIFIPRRSAKPYQKLIAPSLSAISKCFCSIKTDMKQLQTHKSFMCRMVYLKSLV